MTNEQLQGSTYEDFVPYMSEEGFALIRKNKTKTKIFFEENNDEDIEKVRDWEQQKHESVMNHFEQAYLNEER